MNSFCLLSVGLVCCYGLSGSAQTNSSQFRTTVAPARVQGRLVRTKADGTHITSRSASNLLATAADGEPLAAFAYFEHSSAAVNSFGVGDGDGGNQVTEKPRVPASAPQVTANTTSSSVVQKNPPSAESDPVSVRQRPTNTAVQKSEVGPGPIGPQLQPSASLNQYTADIDGKKLGVFERFDGFWKPPPPWEAGIPRVMHGIFWTDPNVVTSPTGFSGSQLWQRTFDPRTSTWTTPPIVAR